MLVQCGLINTDPWLERQSQQHNNNNNKTNNKITIQTSALIRNAPEQRIGKTRVGSVAVRSVNQRAPPAIMEVTGALAMPRMAMK